MKKVLTILGVACIIFSLCACSSSAPTTSSKASKKAVSIGKQAVELIDQYLDGEGEYRAIVDKLDELHHKLEYVYDYTYPYTDEQRADSDIHRYILFATTHITSDHLGGTPENYEKIIEERNIIASLIAEGSR